MSAHARLAPSASHRWLNCTASVDAAARYPDPPGLAAREGTAAHFLLETCLKGGGNPVDFLGRTIRVTEGAIEREFVVTQDMARDVAIGVDYMREVVKTPGWSGVETVVDLGFIEPGTFGTADVWHVSPETGRLTLVDFKYGHNDVSPVENTQLALYVAGILKDIYRNESAPRPDALRLVVVQPRSNMPGPRVKEWDTSTLWLGGFLDGVFEAVTSINRAPEFKAGVWCKYCPAIGECPATKDHAGLALAVRDWNVADMTTADALHILDRVEILDKIVQKAEAHLMDALTHGAVVPGWKLVTGVKHRQWRDENLAKQRLGDEFGAGCLKPPTPSQAEKLGKAAKPIVAELAFTPVGEAVVARDTDKRAPYVAKTAQAMFGPVK